MSLDNFPYKKTIFGLVLAFPHKLVVDRDILELGQDFGLLGPVLVWQAYRQVVVEHTQAVAAHSQVVVAHSQVVAGHNQIAAAHNQVVVVHSQVVVVHSQVVVVHNQVVVVHSQVVVVQRLLVVVAAVSYFVALVDSVSLAVRQAVAAHSPPVHLFHLGLQNARQRHLIPGSLGPKRNSGSSSGSNNQSSSCRRYGFCSSPCHVREQNSSS